MPTKRPDPLSPLLIDRAYNETDKKCVSFRCVLCDIAFAMSVMVTDKFMFPYLQTMGLLSAVCVFLDWQSGASYGQKVVSKADRVGGSVPVAELNYETSSDKAVWLTAKTYNQVFEPYTALGTSDLPRFITSDSLLNGFHVLFEETLHRIEVRSAAQLRNELTATFEGLESSAIWPGKPGEQSIGLRRAKFVMGVAIRLLRPENKIGSFENEVAIESCVAAIEAGAGDLPRDILGDELADALSPKLAQFKPRGFYAKSDSLMRYYRATRWLQTFPLMVDDDEWLRAALAIGAAQIETRSNDITVESEFQTRVFGEKDDLEAYMVAAAVSAERPLPLGEEELKTARRMFAEWNRGKSSSIADFSQTIGHNLRVRSAFALPDAILFSFSTNPIGRPLPNGLEIAACLGSEMAKQSLESDPSSSQVFSAIDKATPLFRGHTLMNDYYQVLRCLGNEPLTTSPDFMRSEGWKIKSCNAMLASWAQMSHTAVLQAKHSETALGGGEELPIAFVEPDPDVFMAISNLAQAMEQNLQPLGKLPAINAYYGDQLRQIADNLSSVESLDKLDVVMSDVDRSLADVRFHLWQIQDNWPSEPGRVPIYVAECQRELRELANVAMNATVKDSGNVSDSWRQLRELAHRLSLIASKQCSNVDPDDDDRQFLKAYGMNLARIMGYDENSISSPSDNAPWITYVHSDLNSQRFLYVAIGRPTQILVRYPWKGNEYICEGAVLPYFEFAAREQLDDVLWRNKFRTGNLPRPPDWVTPMLSN